MESPQTHARRRRQSRPAEQGSAGTDGAAALSASRVSRILIADNEESNRRLMEQVLLLAGFECVLATNGVEALRILDTAPVDLVLLDLSMPVLDGFRTTELIRARPGCAALPIVAVTGHVLGDDLDLALRSGCTAYLVKPFRPRELVRVIVRLLGTS